MDTIQRKRLQNRLTKLSETVETVGNDLLDPLQPYGDDVEALGLAVVNLQHLAAEAKKIAGLAEQRLLDQWPSSDKEITRAVGRQVLTMKMAVSERRTKVRWPELLEALDTQASVSALPGESVAEARLRLRDECTGTTARWAKLAARGLDPDAFSDRQITTKVAVTLV